MKKKVNILLQPDDPANWLVDMRSERPEDGKYTDFYKGILLSDAADADNFEEVTPEWKAEHEYKEPEPETEPEKGE